MRYYSFPVVIDSDDDVKNEIESAIANSLERRGLRNLVVGQAETPVAIVEDGLLVNPLTMESESLSVAKADNPLETARSVELDGEKALSQKDNALDVRRKELLTSSQKETERIAVKSDSTLGVSPKLVASMLLSGATAGAAVAATSKASKRIESLTSDAQKVADSTQVLPPVEEKHELKLSQGETSSGSRKEDTVKDESQKTKLPVRNMALNPIALTKANVSINGTFAVIECEIPGDERLVSLFYKPDKGFKSKVTIQDRGDFFEKYCGFSRYGKSGKILIAPGHSISPALREHVDYQGNVDLALSDLMEAAGLNEFLAIGSIIHETQDKLMMIVHENFLRTSSYKYCDWEKSQEAWFPSEVPQLTIEVRDELPFGAVSDEWRIISPYFRRSALTIKNHENKTVAVFFNHNKVRRFYGFVGDLKQNYLSSFDHQIRYSIENDPGLKGLPNKSKIGLLLSGMIPWFLKYSQEAWEWIASLSPKDSNLVAISSSDFESFLGSLNKKTKRLVCDGSQVISHMRIFATLCYIWYMRVKGGDKHFSLKEYPFEYRSLRSRFVANKDAGRVSQQVVNLSDFLLRLKWAFGPQIPGYSWFLNNITKVLESLGGKDYLDDSSREEIKIAFTAFCFTLALTENEGTFNFATIDSGKQADGSPSPFVYSSLPSDGVIEFMENGVVKREKVSLKWSNLAKSLKEMEKSPRAYYHYGYGPLKITSDYGFISPWAHSEELQRVASTSKTESGRVYNFITEREFDIMWKEFIKKGETPPLVNPSLFLSSLGELTRKYMSEGFSSFDHKGYATSPLRFTPEGSLEIQMGRIDDKHAGYPTFATRFLVLLESLMSSYSNLTSYEMYFYLTSSGAQESKDTIFKNYVKGGIQW